jgi:hypothetical protein
MATATAAATAIAAAVVFQPVAHMVFVPDSIMHDPALPMILLQARIAVTMSMPDSPPSQTTTAPASLSPFPMPTFQPTASSSILQHCIEQQSNNITPLLSVNDHSNYSSQ